MEIQNVVASINLDTNLPLIELLDHLPKSEYEPEQFPALIWRLENRKASFLIFKTGKIVCIGSKTVKAAREAFDNLISKLRKAKIKGIPRKYRVKVENVVATDQITDKLDLDNIAFDLRKSEYEPETFPGIVYRIYEPKASFLLFSSGKIVCAGAKKITDVKKAIKQLEKDLKEIDAI